MPTVQFIHWKPAEAQEHLAQLKAAGLTVRFEPFRASTLERIKSDPPDLVVIDLDRVPSQGRDVGMNLRIAKATRFVPLVFVGGSKNKVKRVTESLPDAIYSTWDGIENAIKDALQKPLVDPYVPQSTMAGYSGTPLPKKLGIRENTIVNLINPPEGFRATLGDLPKGVRIRKGIRKLPPEEHVITLWFVRSKSTLEKKIRQVRKFATGGRLWIIWPKKSSPLATELTQNDVRQTGLRIRLVDFKICAVDRDWSGLRFSLRKDKSI